MLGSDDPWEFILACQPAMCLFDVNTPYGESKSGQYMHVKREGEIYIHIYASGCVLFTCINFTLILS